MKLNNTIRSIISAVFGVLLLFACVKLASAIAGRKSKPETVYNKVVQNVYVDTVKNSDMHLQIKATGNIQAKRKIELYAEVQGIFLPTGKAFKEGQAYSAGSPLIQLDQQEYKASLLAARSNFFSLLTSAMPDLFLDFPSESQKWQNYLEAFDIQKTCPALPNMGLEQEKYYISSKGIINSYYNIKNMEERLAKYQIIAPFTGILTEALVSEGALVRAGQKLGEFIDPSVYELELSINESYKNLLQIGNSVKLYNLDKSKSYLGKVVRVNSVIDASTQSIQAYIELGGKDLNEGMYLAAELEGREEEDVYEISRKLLIDNKAIYAVKDSSLILQEVQPIYFTKETAILRGIPNGTLILNKAVPGAHSGMLVKIANN